MGPSIEKTEKKFRNEMVSSNIWPLYCVSYIRRHIDSDRNKVRFKILSDKSIGHFAPNQPISGESEKSKNEKIDY